MNLVFDTAAIARPHRYAAWRDAICDFYVQVDVKATRPEDYRGFIRESRFGEVVLTDILLSEQRIRREDHHISRLDKACCYLQFIRTGHVDVLQHGASHASDAAHGALFSAVRPYELRCAGEVRSLYVELPRDALLERFPNRELPDSALLPCAQGLGRIARDFCQSLASTDGEVGEPARHQLGEQLLDLVALSLQADGLDTEITDRSVRRLRLQVIQRWIEDHLGDAGLTLAHIAAANGVSLRYLHLLFSQCDESASEWLWNRRLQLCFDVLAGGTPRSITAVAFDHGFASASHFSTLFKRRFGVSPSDVARAPQRRD